MVGDEYLRVLIGLIWVWWRIVGEWGGRGGLGLSIDNKHEPVHEK